MFRIATNLTLNSVRDDHHRQMEISMDQSMNAGDEEQPAMQAPDRATLKELAHLHVGMAADSPGM